MKLNLEKHTGSLYEISKELEKIKMYKPPVVKKKLKHKLLIGFHLTPLGRNWRF